jgi:predicted nucleic acid-binding protein
MAFGAVLDTCVLYPFSLCDILLRLADRELYDPYWSGRVLEELARNLVGHGLTPAQAGHRIEQMRRSFPDAEIAGAAVARLEPAMTNDPKDRHVLAAAVASRVDAVVTFNVRDFAAEACGPYDVDVLHPDRFLVDLYELDPSTVEAEITAQAAALRRPPVTRGDLARMLDRAGAPVFADRLARAFVRARWSDLAAPPDP